NIAGYQFTGIEGGFGEGKKAMLVKEIAGIHEKEVKHINLRINENRSRYCSGKMAPKLTTIEVIAKQFGINP
ncbi:hypothetical protein N3930_47755, partial [Bacillus thuringiensis]|nr:hypothetical protein [Bacillus thuringiensis]